MSAAEPPGSPPAAPDEPPAPRWHEGRLAVLGGAFVGAFVGSVLTRGVPVEREQVLAWLMAGLLVVALSSPRHRAGRVVLDWLPFLAVLVVYDYSRGWADELGQPIHWDPQIRADELLFGGVVPTVWLQERLIDEERVHGWEVAMALLYLSHFVVPFVVAAWLWVRDRARWLAFTVRFVALSFLGVATFVIFPAAPPWLASRTGHLDAEVARTSARGWSIVGLDIAERLVSKGQAAVNLTAAIPSLHAAYAALVAVFLWPMLGIPGRVVACAYALAMAFMLVLGGEHYVVDVLVGWAYVAVVHLGVGRLERWWSSRRSSDDAQVTPRPR